MRLTDRDIKILDFMENIGCISSSQIQRIFDMSVKTQNRRMNKLIEEFSIKKIKCNPTHNFFDNKKQILKNENVYYYGKKPKCLEHDLLLNEFYIKLLENQNDVDYNILTFDTKFKIVVDGFVVIPDARVVIKYKGVEYEYLIELENNKSFNYKKYYALEQRGYYCCPVVVVSNRRVQNYCKYLEVLKIKLNMNDFNTFLSDFISNSYEKDEKNVVLEAFKTNPF